MVTRNVAMLVDTPRAAHHEITPLTPEQALVLIDAAVADRHRALWITALGTGLRQGELLALRGEDGDLEAGRLRVRHGLANVGGELTWAYPWASSSGGGVVQKGKRSADSVTSATDACGGSSVSRNKARYGE